MSDNFELQESLQEEIENLLLENERYLCYLALLSRRYRKREIFMKWLVAVSSCTPFVAKIQNISVGLSSWFLALTPLVAVLLPLVDHDKVIDAAQALHGKIALIVPDIKNLLRKIEKASDKPYEKTLTAAADELATIEKKLAEFRKEKLAIPDIRSLHAEAVNAVPRRRASRTGGGGSYSAGLVNFSR